MGLPRQDDPDVSALLPVLRGVVARRIRDPADREDMVQEALARTLAARDRLPPDALAPYAVTVARNLVAASHSRAALERRHRPRLIDLTVADRPDEALVRGEEADAVRAAVLALPAAEREVLVGSVTAGKDTATLAAATGGTPGGIAARLARARARARVDYVLALRRQELPSPLCRPVLLAVSAADRRRQAALDADGHLRSCAVCPRLVEPLRRRSSALAGLVPLPLLLLAPRVRRAVRAQPAQAAVAAGVVLAVGGVSAAAVFDSPARAPQPAAVAPPPVVPARSAAPSAAAPAPVPVPVPVETGGAADRARAREGDVVVLSGTVDDVSAPYGFWLDTEGDRVYVVFDGLPPRRVRLRDRVRLTGTVTQVSAGVLADRALVDAADVGAVARARMLVRTSGPALAMTR